MLLQEKCRQIHGVCGYHQDYAVPLAAAAQKVNGGNAGSHLPAGTNGVD
jgi:hypothetical protein